MRGVWFSQLVCSQGTAAALTGSRKAIIERCPAGSGLAVLCTWVAEAVVLEEAGGADGVVLEEVWLWKWHRACMRHGQQRGE